MSLLQLMPVLSHWLSANFDSYNEPGVEGAKAIAEGLSHVTCLQTLELWSVVLDSFFGTLSQRMLFLVLSLILRLCKSVSLSI